MQPCKSSNKPLFSIFYLLDCHSIVHVMPFSAKICIKGFDWSSSVASLSMNRVPTLRFSISLNRWTMIMWSSLFKPELNSLSISSSDSVVGFETSSNKDSSENILRRFKSAESTKIPCWFIHLCSSLCLNQFIVFIRSRFSPKIKSCWSWIGMVDCCSHSHLPFT